MNYNNTERVMTAYVNSDSTILIEIEQNNTDSKGFVTKLQNTKTLIPLCITWGKTIASSLAEMDKQCGIHYKLLVSMVNYPAEEHTSE